MVILGGKSTIILSFLVAKVELKKSIPNTKNQQ